MATLSIIIPVYNERHTLPNILTAVEKSEAHGLRKEIIVVDDGSTDGSREYLNECRRRRNYRVFFHDVNKGKGAAVRLGFSEASGDYVIIQDADLEYDPNDYAVMLRPLLAGTAQVIYGSRFISTEPRRVLFFWHYVGNKILTFLSNILTNMNLSDIETGYKAFTIEAVKKIAPRLRANRFDIEPEITARVSQMGLRVYEVGISYAGRTYAEGKKIGWLDGVSALWAIIKYNLLTS